MLNTEIYLNRPNSYLMAVVMNGYKISKKKYAKYLGVSYAYLNNKFNRNNFSIRDIYILVYLMGGNNRAVTMEYLKLTGDWERIEALRVSEEGEIK